MRSDFIYGLKPDSANVYPTIMSERNEQRISQDKNKWIESHFNLIILCKLIQNYPNDTHAKYAKRLFYYFYSAQ